MLDEAKKDLSKYRLEQATNILNSSEIMLNSDDLKTSINR